jgi:hypothetical protein
MEYGDEKVAYPNRLLITIAFYSFVVRVAKIPVELLIIVRISIAG